MGRISKFNFKIKADILSLAREGYSNRQSAEIIGVSLRTFQYWVTKYNLSELIEQEKSDSAKNLIEIGLRRLASGAEDHIQKDKFVTHRVIKKTCEETGEEIETIIPVEREITKKVKAPDSKAIEILARKYDKSFAEKDSKGIELNLNPILEGFTGRDLQESLKHNPIDLHSVVDAEFTEID